MFIKTIAIVMMAAINLTPLALAQEPADQAAGQAEAEAGVRIEQWESRYGMPLSATAEIGPVVSAEVEDAPDAAKKYLGNDEQVAIYCAMAKYKSGGLLAALSAVRTELYPALEKVRALAIEPGAPDIAALESEAGKRLDAICQAAIVDDAARLAKEFRTWGEQDVRTVFRDWRAELTDKIKGKGDSLRTVIKTELEELAAAEKQSAEADMRAEADRLAAEKRQAIEAAAQSDPAGAESLAAAAGDEIEARMRNLAAEKKIAIEAKLQAKADEIAGDRKKGFEELNAAFNGMEGKIAQAAADKMTSYQGYKDEADRLRLAATLKVVDRSLEEVTEKLKARIGEIEAARKENGQLKSADIIITELQADRRSLEDKITVALKAGDEAAYQAALATFQSGWQEYQAEMERAMSKSLEQACTRAVAQLTGAKPKIGGNIERVTAFIDKCRQSETPECQAAKDWNERLVVIRQKSQEYLDVAAVVESACAAAALDRNNIATLLNKLKNDGEDLRLYGEALAAARADWAADSTVTACRQALADTRAGLSETEKNDLAALDSYDKACARSKTDCPLDAGNRSRLGKARSALAKYKAEYQAAEKYCQGVNEDTDLGALATTLNTLLTGGQAIRSEIQAIRLVLGEKLSARAFCRTAEVRIAGLAGESARNKEAAGEWTAVLAGVEGQVALKARVKDFGERIVNLEKITREAATACTVAGDDRPSEDLIARLEALSAEAEPLKADFAILGAAVDALRSGAGILVEAENAARYNTRTGVSNPMAKEVRPKWRPSFSGTGDWYMGADKDYLEYDINIPKAGKYRIFARDYFDAYQPRGVRKFTLLLDGKAAGSYAENRSELPAGVKSVFAWHQLGDAVDLKAGKLKLKIVKDGTTSGAVILDALYLTTGAEAPAEITK